MLFVVTYYIYAVRAQICRNGALNVLDRRKRHYGKVFFSFPSFSLVFLSPSLAGDVEQAVNEVEHFAAKRVEHVDDIVIDFVNSIPFLFLFRLLVQFVGNVQQTVGGDDVVEGLGAALGVDAAADVGEVAEQVEAVEHDDQIAFHETLG